MASSWTVTEALITLVISGCLSRIHLSACLGFSTSECILWDEEVYRAMDTWLPTHTGPYSGMVRLDQTVKSPLEGKVQALSFGLVFPKTVWIPLGSRGGWSRCLWGSRAQISSPHIRMPKALMVLIAWWLGKASFYIPENVQNSLPGPGRVNWNCRRPKDQEASV